MILFPFVRRFLSPILVIVLTFFLILAYLLVTPSTTSLPQWKSYGYPPSVDIDLGPKLDHEPLAFQPLAAHFEPFLPSLTLPSELDTPLYRPLARRLYEFLGRPGFDIPQFEQLSEEGCPLRISDKISPMMENMDWWDGVDPNEMAKRRAEIVSWLTAKINGGGKVLGDLDVGEGRGIVMTGGNQDTTLRMITTLRHLRRLDVQLPIEVFHYPDELHDLGQRREIEKLGATIREAKGVDKVEGVWKNWQIKGLALVQSSFREVLYLDSDNIPLRDPSHLFSAPLYTQHGRAVFWPDLTKDHPRNAIWRIVGKPCNLNSWTFESAQIIVDKAGNNGLNLAALIVAAEMQGERDWWFNLCGGDKDTFRWAFEMLGLEYEESPRWMSAAGFMNNYEGDRFCGHTVLQYDLVVPPGFEREPPLFVHSNLLKHLGNTGLGRGNVFTHVKRFTDDSAHLQTLNYAHTWVYQGVARGMCIDMEWQDTAADDLPLGEMARVGIETIGVGELEGDVMRGFEDAFFDEGGRVGGW